jgi:hypothetical protein
VDEVKGGERMTYLEKYQLEHPDHDMQGVINKDCPGDFYEGGAKNCSDQCFETENCTHCWNQEIPEEKDTIEGKFTIAKSIEEEEKTTPIPHKPEKQPSKLIAKITPKIDISKLIDEAMEKKDRYVTVFVNNEGHMSINVYPYEKDEPRWTGEHLNYKCSACGCHNNHPTPYCPECGEKLKLPE